MSVLRQIMFISPYLRSAMVWFPLLRNDNWGVEYIQSNRYCFVYWAILENIAPAARTMRGINSFSIALLGKPILKVKFIFSVLLLMSRNTVIYSFSLWDFFWLCLWELPWAQAIPHCTSFLSS